jgi:hypothetical protein
LLPYIIVPVFYAGLLAIAVVVGLHLGHIWLGQLFAHAFGKGYPVQGYWASILNKTK